LFTYLFTQRGRNSSKAMIAKTRGRNRYRCRHGCRYRYRYEFGWRRKAAYGSVNVSCGLRFAKY
jgi:hypothetical protein